MSKVCFHPYISEMIQNYENHEIRVIRHEIRSFREVILLRELGGLLLQGGIQLKKYQINHFQDIESENRLYRHPIYKINVRNFFLFNSSLHKVAFRKVIFLFSVFLSSLSIFYKFEKKI